MSLPVRGLLILPVRYLTLRTSMSRVPRQDRCQMDMSNKCLASVDNGIYIITVHLMKSILAETLVLLRKDLLKLFGGV